jgi:flagellar biosynthesis/type III secretory pathway protein FliH
MTTLSNLTAAAMVYAGSWVAFRTWKWALRSEAEPEAQPEPESAVIPWSEVLAPNVFRPRQPQPQRRPVPRQTRQAHLLRPTRQTRQARLVKLSARCEDIRHRLERGIQAAWREGTRKSRRRMRALEERLAVLERRIERLRVMGWTEAAGARR